MRLSFTYSLALLATLVLRTCFPSHLARADASAPSSVAATTECAAGVPVRLPMAPELQRVKSENPSILCVFRHRTKGFPTLNVVAEPRLEGTKPPTLEEYQEGVRKGYKVVGLHDATLTSSVVGESNGLPFFKSEITFTNNGVPMVARILVIQHHDRTYTASAIAEARPLDAGRALTASLIDGIEIDGEPIRDTRSRFGIWPLLGAACATLFLAYVGYRSLRPHRGRI